MQDDDLASGSRRRYLGQSSHEEWQMGFCKSWSGYMIINANAKNNQMNETSMCSHFVPTHSCTLPKSLTALARGSLPFIGLFPALVPCDRFLFPAHASPGCLKARLLDSPLSSGVCLTVRVLDELKFRSKTSGRHGEGLCLSPLTLRLYTLERDSLLIHFPGTASAGDRGTARKVP